MFTVTKFSKWLRWERLAVVLAGAVGCSLAAWAQDAPPDTAELTEATQRWLNEAVAHASASTDVTLRMQVSLGQLDTRLRLAPCRKIDFHIPVGMRLWGKTRLGIRCLEGVTKWNVFLPITIHAYGPAWVLRDPVASGAVLSANDAIQAEVDWAEEASPVLAQLAQWVGQITTRPLLSGQTLRQSMVKPAQVFQAGAQVRVLAQGVGFQVSADGQALSAGVVGQLARIKMDNGRIMSGLVLDSRTVKVDM